MGGDLLDRSSDVTAPLSVAGEISRCPAPLLQAVCCNPQEGGLLFQEIWAQLGCCAAAVRAALGPGPAEADQMAVSRAAVHIHNGTPEAAAANTRNLASRSSPAANPTERLPTETGGLAAHKVRQGAGRASLEAEQLRVANALPRGLLQLGFRHAFAASQQFSLHRPQGN